MSIKDRLKDVKIAQKLREAGAEYQAALVSGTNIKTINGSSVLGSGNLVVSGGATPIYANAQRQATQSISAGSWVAVSFDTEGADSGSLFSTSNPTYIEVPSDGIYTVTAYVPWTASPGSGSRGITITKNSTPGSDSLCSTYAATVGNTETQCCAWTGTLAANDKLYLYVITTNADSIRVNTGIGACFLGVMGFAT